MVSTRRTNFSERGVTKVKDSGNETGNSTQTANVPEAGIAKVKDTGSEGGNSTRKTDFPKGDVVMVNAGSESLNGSTLIQMTRDQLSQLIQAAVQAVVPYQGGTGVVPHQGGIDDVHGNQFAKINKVFSLLGGTKFSGETGAIEAIDWIMQCDTIFETIGLTSVEERELAAHQLTGSALYWWHNQREGMDPKVLDEMTWVDFKALFEKRFVPGEIKAQLHEEFNQLVQGGRSVSEYMKRFIKLSVYAPHMVKGTMKNEKFIRGLRPEIRRIVLSVMNQPFSVIYDLALRIEQVDNEDMAANLTTYGPIRHRVGANRGGWNEPYGPTHNFKRGLHHRPNRQEQMIKSNPIQAMPLAGGGQITQMKLCFRCGDPSHIARDCSQNRDSKKVKDQDSFQLTVTPDLHDVVMYRHPNLIQAMPVAGGQVVIAKTDKCYSCGRGGHMVRDCPNMPAPPVAAEGQVAKALCFGCGDPSHRVKDCPNRDPSMSRKRKGKKREMSRVGSTHCERNS